MIRSVASVALLALLNIAAPALAQSRPAAPSSTAPSSTAPGPVSPFARPARLTVPDTVTGAVGTLLHVKGTSPAKVFVWLAGSDGLDVFTPAAGVDQSQCAVRAANAGTYRLWCVAVLGDKTATGLVTVTITGTAPAPPAPAPPAPPAPAAAGKLFAVVIETPAGAPTRGQMFADPALSAYMKIKGHAFRIVDANVVGADGKAPADVAPYLALAAGKTLPQLFLVSAAGRVLYAGALPQTADALLAQIKKVGG